MKSDRTEVLFERLIDFFCYGFIFSLPISVATLEIFSGFLIFSWISKQCYLFFFKGCGKFFFEECFKTYRSICKTPLTKNSIALAIFIYFAVSLISLFGSVNLGLSLIGVFLKTGKSLIILYIFLGEFGNTKRNKFKAVLVALCLSAVLIFSDALVQLFSGRDFIRGNVSGRLSASFKNANGLAGWLIVILPVLLNLVNLEFKNNKFNLKAIFKTAAFILILTGVFLLTKTVSKGALVGFIISSLLIISLSFLYAINRLKKILIFYGLLSLAILFMSLYSKESIIDRIKLFKRTINEKTEIRILLWKECVYVIEGHPLFGTGPNTYTFVVQNYKLKKYSGTYPHNSYLQLTAELGLVGLCSFLYILYCFFVKTMSALKKHKDPLLLGLMGGLVACLIHSFFDVNLFTVQLGLLFWAMLGLALARIRYLNNIKTEDKLYTLQI